MAELRLALDLPPSVNHSHVPAKRRSRRTGKVYTAQVPSRELKMWRSRAWWAVFKAKVRENWQTIPAGVPVVVELAYFWPDRRRRDTHNRIKATMDLLQAAGVFADDRQALAVETGFAVDRERPRLELRIYAKGAA